MIEAANGSSAPRVIAWNQLCKLGGQRRPSGGCCALRCIQVEPGSATNLKRLVASQPCCVLKQQKSPLGSSPMFNQCKIPWIVHNQPKSKRMCSGCPCPPLCLGTQRFRMESWHASQHATWLLFPPHIYIWTSSQPFGLKNLGFALTCPALPSFGPPSCSASGKSGVAAPNPAWASSAERGSLQ